MNKDIIDKVSTKLKRDKVMRLLINDRTEDKIIKPETIESLSEIIKEVKNS